MEKNNTTDKHSKEWLSLQEAADYLGVHINTIRNLLHRGLPWKAVGRRKIISRRELDNYNNRMQS